MKYRDIKIKNKIIVLFSAIFIAVAFSLGVNYWATQNINKSTNELGAQAKLLEITSNLRFSIEEAHLRSHMFLLVGKPEQKQNFYNSIAAAREQNKQISELANKTPTIQAHISHAVSGEDNILSALSEDLSETESIVTELFNNKNLAITARLMPRYMDIISKIDKKIDTLTKHSDDDVRLAQIASDKVLLLNGRIIYLSGGIILLSILVSLFIFFRSIIQPLYTLTNTTIQVAKGNLGKRTQTRSKDELGILAQNFNTMIDSLLIEGELRRNIISTLPSPLFLTDEKGIIQITNPSASKLLGYTEQEFKGKPITVFFSTSVIAPPTPVPFFSALKNLGLNDLTEKGFMQDRFVIMISKDNTEIPVTLTGSIFQHKKHNGLNALFVAVDRRSAQKYAAKRLSQLTPVFQKISTGDFNQKIKISEKKDEFTELLSGLNLMMKDLLEYERERKKFTAQQIKHAKEIARLKDEFVFVATHELRSPVTIISGYIEMILEKNGQLDKDVKENLLNIKKADDRLKSLINDLLEVAKTEAGKIKINISPQQIETIIENALLELNLPADQKAISLNYKTKPNLPEVLADSRKLQEVLINLLSNAIKYTPTKGSVVIGHKLNDNFLITYISDTGIGLSKEEQGHIFEKFWRSEKTEVHRVAGTGLGLFIAKELIERMDGKIWVESEEGKGSTFFFQLNTASKKI